MGNFNYPPSTNNVHYISAIIDYPRDEIFQIKSFCMNYFNDLWNLPSPLAMMEGTRLHGMAMPLSMAEVAYSIVQQASANPDLTPAQELDLILEPIWA
jgi:hypothetical protein